MNTADDDEIERVLLGLVEARRETGSICPSEVARAIGVGEAWRSRMGDVRRVAVRLAGAGRIEILRKGKPVQVDEVRGVIRLRVARP